MEAADPGAGRGGVAGDAEGQGGLDGPGDPNGPEGHEGLGGAGEAGAAVAGAPELVQAPHAPGPGGDAMPGPGGHAAPGPGGHVAPGPGVHGALGPGGHARLWTLGHAASGHGGCVPPVARGPRSQLLNFSIVVLFPSPMEAEMAHQSLSPHAQPYHRAVGKELTVNRSILAIQLTAEDGGQLQTSIMFCLKQLFLLLGINQPITGHFVPLVIPKPKPRKSA